MKMMLFCCCCLSAIGGRLHQTEPVGEVSFSRPRPAQGYSAPDDDFDFIVVVDDADSGDFGGLVASDYSVGCWPQKSNVTVIRIAYVSGAPNLWCHGNAKGKIRNRIQWKLSNYSCLVKCLALVTTILSVQKCDQRGAYLYRQNTLLTLTDRTCSSAFVEVKRSCVRVLSKHFFETVGLESALCVAGGWPLSRFAGAERR